MKTLDEKLDDLEQRLKRVETRLVNGFSQLGVTFTSTDTHITVDTERYEVHISTPATTVGAILRALKRAEAPSAVDYAVVYGGENAVTFYYHEDDHEQLRCEQGG